MDRILIMDDDRELFALIQKSVLAEGIAADCCHSGREGLGKLQSARREDHHHENAPWT